MRKANPVAKELAFRTVANLDVLFWDAVQCILFSLSLPIFISLSLIWPYPLMVTKYIGAVIPSIFTIAIIDFTIDIHVQLKMLVSIYDTRAKQ